MPAGECSEQQVMMRIHSYAWNRNTNTHRKWPKSCFWSDIISRVLEKKIEKSTGFWEKNWNLAGFWISLGVLDWKSVRYLLVLAAERSIILEKRWSLLQMWWKLARRNMIEQLREKYLWKDGFSDMAKWGEEGGQIGGGGSRGSSEIILGEKFSAIGSNALSTHGRFQLYPILPTHILFWLWKWPLKLKYLFFRVSFSRLTFKSGGDPV